jgi:hydroxymethylpyrimidine kinase/phosphomethylpyrimidine kinase
MTMMAALALDHIHCLVLSIILCHALQSLHAATAFASSQNDIRTKISDGMKNVAPPSIVYTIAGSDSGGGAGIQADLKAIHTISGGTCHGCSAITCLTSQNSCGVTAVHSPPVEFLREQLSTLESDLFPTAVKVGMLGTRELAEEVGEWLKKIKKHSIRNNTPFVVVDPVMISTSGHKLIDDTAKSAMVQKVFPYADLITPNKFEAEELLGRKLQSPEDVELGAREILAMGARAVLIKGGHSLKEEQGKGISDDENNVSVEYAQDYLLMSSEMAEEGKPVKDQQRLCDGSRGVWLRNERYDTIHTHGTGCTLSSSIAAAWAMGQREREDESNKSDDCNNIGALSSMYLVDACCIAKAYVNAGIARSVQVRRIPG